MLGAHLVLGAPTLPPLETVNSRERYRERPEDELEEVTWPDPDNPKAWVPPSKARLVSVASEEPAVIVFNNVTGLRARALWVDFEGHEVAYSVIEPGTSKRYRTYATHPWIVREIASRSRLMLGASQVVVGIPGEVKVDITLPPTLPWTLSTHELYPESFKAATRTLLLCHKRLATMAAQSTGQAADGPASQDAPTPAALSSPLALPALKTKPATSHSTGAPLSPKRMPLALTVACSPRAAQRLKFTSPPASPRHILAAPTSPRTTLAPPPAGSEAMASPAVSDSCVPHASTHSAASTFSPTCSAVCTRGGSSSKNSMWRTCGNSSSGTNSSSSNSSSRGLLSLLSSAARHLFLPRSNPRISSLQCSRPAAPPGHPHYKALAASPAAAAPAPAPLATIAEEANSWMPCAPVEPGQHHGSHLGVLPSHMMLDFVEAAACLEVVYQDLWMPPHGHPDIHPARLAAAPPPPGAAAAVNDGVVEGDGGAAAQPAGGEPGAGNGGQQGGQLQHPQPEPHHQVVAAAAADVDALVAAAAQVNALVQDANAAEDVNPAAVDALVAAAAALAAVAAEFAADVQHQDQHEH